MAESTEAPVGEGDLAPDIALPKDGGGTFHLKDAAKVALFFFPKADTSGCTKEALGFTELADEFAKLGVAIVGVSKDPIAKQDKFKAKHALNLTLLSDAEGDVSERYGVWVEKSMYGRRYMGIDRSTFLIREGRIVRAWRKAKVPGHAEAVLEAAREL